jgi:hypothetical protein
VSKAFGEYRRPLAVWLEPEDLVSLIRIGLAKERLPIVVNSSAEALGYDSEGRRERPITAETAGQSGLA